MKINLCIVSIIISLLPLCIKAQPKSQGITSISGKVLDDQGAGVSYGAVVVSLCRDSMIVSSALTKEDGAFELSLADSLGSEPLMVEVSCIRYNNKVVQCPLGVSDLPKVITLSDASINEKIDEVVVSGKKTSFTRQGDRYVFRISPELEVAKGSSIYDILKITPLVKVEQESITVAGAGAPQIYINGRRSRLSAMGLLSYLKGIPASSLSAIEVMPIANSTYYGEGNFSVIDIKIKKNQGDGVGGMVSISTDQNHANSQSGNFNVNVRKGKLGVNSSAWLFNNGGTRSADDRSMFFLESGKSSDNSSRSFSSMQFGGADLTLDYDINDNQVIGLSVNASYGQSSRRSNSQTIYKSAFNTIIDSLYNTGVSGYGNNMSAAANINYQLKVGDKGSTFNVEAGYIDYANLDRNTTIFDRLNEDMSVKYNLDSMFQRLPQKTVAWTAMARYDHAFGRWGTISLGSDFQTTHSNDNSYYATGNWGNKNDNLSNHFVYTETVAAMFTSYRVSWTDKFSTTLGGRVEYTHTRAEQRTTGDDVNNYRLKFLPTAYISYSFNDDNSLSYSVSFRSDFPGYSYLNSFRTYSSPTHYSQGNPYLKPERCFNQGLDYNYKGKLSLMLSHMNRRDAPREFTTPDGDNGTKSQVTNFGRNTQIFFAIGMMGSYFDGIWWPNNYVTIGYDEMNGVVEDQSYIKGCGLLGLSLYNTFTVSKKHNLSFSVGYSTYYVTDSDVGTMKPGQYLSLDIKKGFGDFYVSLYGSDILGTGTQRGMSINNGIKTNIYMQSSSQQFGVQLSYTFGNSSVRRARQLGDSSSGVKSRL